MELSALRLAQSATLIGWTWMPAETLAFCDSTNDLRFRDGAVYDWAVHVVSSFSKNYISMTS